MQGQRDNLIEEIIQAQKTIFLEMHAASAPLWLELDLTIAQVKALFTLGTHGPITVGRAARELGIGKPSASILIDRLVHVGLVDRQEDPDDRRRAIIRLTPQGEDLVAQLWQGRRERMFDSLMRMDDEDLEALLKGLAALSVSLAASRLAVLP